MTTRSVRVIKNNGAAVGGSVRIGPGMGHAPVRTHASSRTHTPAAGACQQARIIESNAEYAIIEITCACGQKSHIQCNYANVG